MRLISILTLFFSLWFSLISSITSANECLLPPAEIENHNRLSSKERFRFVHYNVEWLFTSYYSNAKCPGSGCAWDSINSSYQHLSHVSDVINKLEPDLIHFCEIEDCSVINELKNRMKETEVYVPLLIQGTDTSTGQNVGLMTRIDPVGGIYRTNEKYDYPIAETEIDYTGNGGTTSVSKNLYGLFHAPMGEIMFIGTHLLAYPTDIERSIKREAQAQILQNLIWDSIESGYDILFAGDLNDYDGLVLDINNHKPISAVLDILKGNKGDYAGKYALKSVAERIDHPYRFSNWWNSDGNCCTTDMEDFSMIDHVLVSESLFDKISNAFIYHGYKEYCGKWNSDHYPVVVDFFV